VYVMFLEVFLGLFWALLDVCRALLGVYRAVMGVCTVF